jgi:hypothetical protein
MLSTSANIDSHQTSQGARPNHTINNQTLTSLELTHGSVRGWAKHPIHHQGQTTSQEGLL